MSTKSIDKHFVSNVDKRIREYDKRHSPSESQQAEMQKYKRIYELRDSPVAKTPKTDIWD